MRHPVFRNDSSAAEELDGMLEKMPSKLKRKVKQPVDYLVKASIEADAMRLENDWSRVRGKHLVAIYDWLHSNIYGFEASELLDPAHYFPAVKLADKLISRHFNGDATAAVKFVSWCWAREKNRLEYSAETENKFRLTWKLQFGTNFLLSEYRFKMIRTRTRKIST
jgi:hypothetical protein